MKKLISIILSIVFIVVGVFFVINGISTLKDKDLYDSEVTATVTDVQEYWDDSDPEDAHTELTVYIDYEVDGKKYEHVECPETSGSMSVGDKVDILYQSGDPSKISGHNITGGAVIFIAAGAIVAIAGCFSTFKSIIKK